MTKVTTSESAVHQSVKWTSIDSQADLDALDRAVCWEDSRVLEYHAGSACRPHYPADVSRSGYSFKDIHVLVEVPCSHAPFLELAFIHCDWVGANAFEDLTLRGRVDVLRRVVLREDDGSDLLRCARLIYRWLAEANTEGSLYADPEARRHDTQT
jgi:hypothetical protein